MTGIKRILFIAIVVPIGMLSSCSKDKSSAPVVAVDSLKINYVFTGAWPHDVDAFTEGLEIHRGNLYESTGREGQSWIGIVNIETGKADKKVTLEDKYFGEGITIVNNKIYQLTYKDKTGFIYDLKTYKRIGTFSYDNTEGWGLTHNSEHIIMSDGTSTLTFLDTTSLKPAKTLVVTDESGKVEKINELEYVDGFIYANVWETNLIVKIDEQTGKVIGRIDLSAKAAEVKMQKPDADVFNGIAYHPASKSFLVTGKHWPFIYILQLKK